jgi:hypothetical protein
MITHAATQKLVQNRNCSILIWGCVVWCGVVWCGVVCETFFLKKFGRQKFAKFII